MRARTFAGLASLILATGCFRAGERLEGVSRAEAFAAAFLTLEDAPADVDPDRGTLVQRFQPGELAHRPGPQRVISLDAGSKVRIHVHEGDNDGVNLEIRCTEERYTPPIPPVDGLRDPEWEGFLRGEILERLRWNRMRASDPRSDSGASQTWGALLVAAYRMLGLEVHLAPQTYDADLGLVLRSRDGRKLAVFGLDEGRGVRWLLLAGPPRVGGDAAMDSIASQARGAGLELLPLAELPATR